MADDRTMGAAERPRARAVFVLGAPRSGTTLVGKYLATSSDVLDLGEYGGFYMAHDVVPTYMGKFPGALRDVYLEDLRAHARCFAEEAAGEAGACRWYCDTTPWNLRCVAALAEQLPDALFVLTLRHYAGVTQSLRRSFAAGFRWAGSSFEEGGRLWAAMYQHVAELPPDRTVVFGYDALAARPDETLAKLERDLRAHGFATAELNRRPLVESHATSFSGRPTVGVLEDESVRLETFSSVDVDNWSGDIHAVVWPAVREVHVDLLRRFPEAYILPPAPTQLRRHDEIRGLVPFDLPGW